MHDATIQAPRRRATLPLIALGFALLAGLVFAGWPGSAESAARKSVVMGARVANLTPNCPGTSRKGCQAIGRVSGFQALAGGANPRPFQVPFDGKIVSWSIVLGKPRARSRGDRAAEAPFFNELFGKPSKARISVLKRIRNTRPVEFKLVRHSPVQLLAPYFGSHVEFALDHPLNVAKGQVVALTIPTWAPAFFTSAACEEVAPGTVRNAAACDRFQDRNTWRASRRKGRCNFTAETFTGLKRQVARSYPHQKIGSQKQYGCYYRGARLTYTATLVRKPAS